MSVFTRSWFGPWLEQRKSRLDELMLMWRAFRRDWLSMLSSIVILIFFVGAIFAPHLTPYPEQGMGDTNIREKLQPPSRAHPLGTDVLGRDILARILFGGRTSLSTGFMVVAIAISIGVPLGAISGYFGGWVDEVIMRVTDVFLAFPGLLLAIAIAAALGPSFTNAMIAISIVWWPWYTRPSLKPRRVSVSRRLLLSGAISFPT